MTYQKVHDQYGHEDYEDSQHDVGDRGEVELAIIQGVYPRGYVLYIASHHHRYRHQ